ncbi:LemA family protein [Erysipelothrix aquatica]|uniref:LemA family protein n=1 Tax=Erysipelothrix aquatica TaxID=2683714 RepID=UPI001F200378|nr:LemA family protein [Erysipelothrix aquatica]
MTDAEEHIQAARRLYNHKVESLNSTIDTFPGNLVNQLAKRERAAFYEAESQQRNNPHINW